MLDYKTEINESNFPILLNDDELNEAIEELYSIIPAEHLSRIKSRNESDLNFNESFKSVIVVTAIWVSGSEVLMDKEWSDFYKKLESGKTTPEYYEDEDIKIIANSILQEEMMEADKINNTTLVARIVMLAKLIKIEDIS